MISLQDMLEGSSSASAYYGQYVSRYIMDVVEELIGREAIENSRAIDCSDLVVPDELRLIINGEISYSDIGQRGDIRSRELIQNIALCAAQMLRVEYIVYR